MRSPMKAALAATALGLSVAGCTEGATATDPTPGVTGSGPATTTAPAGPAGPVASCVTGDWRSTAASGRASAGTASAQLSGGGGIAFTVGPNGETTVDFTGMQPAAFTVAVAGTDVTGTFTYAGAVDGTVRTSGGAAATSGTWEPVGTVDWTHTRLTLDLTKPVQARVLDDATIGDYVGDGADRTGNVVDVDPLLGKGTFECQGDTLVLAPDTGNDTGITWTLRRAAAAPSPSPSR